VWTSPRVRTITWNGVVQRVSRTARGSLQGRLPGPAPVTLPALTTWKWSAESPEANPAFDDSSFVDATLTTTNSTTKPPAGQPVLTADDYGFHHGDVWYRGRVTGPLPETVSFTYGGGGAGMLQAWVDGRYLGQHVLSSAVTSPPTTGTAAFPVPAGLGDGEHVVSVMVRNDGHNEDGGVNDAHKEGRGLISSTLTTAAWKVQGAAKVDPVRGVVNNGGLYGERAGWYLPSSTVDRSWTRHTVPDTTAIPGTSWYRTTFDLHVPREDDASIGLTIGDPAVLRSGGHYRVLIFCNGWNVGQYIADVGPQHTFVLPNGVLDPNGRNTIALAVTSDGGPADVLERVQLTNLGTVRGGAR
jgi:beta-galactosidase GanA